MIGTIYALIPPIVMILLVLLTRKVILSLGVGIILGAFIITEFHIWEGISVVWTAFLEIFYVNGEFDLGNIYLLLFLIFLGIMTAYMAASGGTKAFGDWAISKIKTRKGSQLVPFFLGIIIFIDDYFNSLAVGQVARPITDKHKVSRAKLAYIIDSTSAPITVLAPISSWGAYIIGTIAELLEKNNVVMYQPLEAFIRMIPMNFYAMTAVVFVFIVILFNINFGPMKKHEIRAIQTGELVDPNRKDMNTDIKENLLEPKEGKISYLVAPLFVLIVVTVMAMFYTGVKNTTGHADIFDVFTYTDVNLSLFFGGLISVLFTIGLYYFKKGQKASNAKVIMEGSKSMLPAISILIFAWMLGTIIEQLQTGSYLADQVVEMQLDVEWLPVIMFVICSTMAFATGTSWGTFGIMLPIAASIAVNLDVQILLPTLAAVLAGSVFGDHCSPISDTTILSSTGARANHIDHVLTQLPYAILSAIVSLGGYIILGYTESIIVSLVFTFVLLGILTFVLSIFSKNNS